MLRPDEELVCSRGLVESVEWVESVECPNIITNRIKDLFFNVIRAGEIMMLCVSPSSQASARRPLCPCKSV